MKYIAINCLCVGLFLLSTNDLKAQVNVDLYRNVISSGSKKKSYSIAKNNKNELDALFSGLFLSYKTFFSSQDLSVCTFTPSCSEYGIICVKNYGLLKGGVMTMDRLTRCNGLSPQNYMYDKKTMTLLDDPRVKNDVKLVNDLK